MPIILDGTTGITTPGITNTGEFVFQGPIQVPAGSAASASVTTAAGPDTGLYFPSSSSIAITTAGTEKVSVGTGLVINDGGADFDTRIEGDTDANLFFVDASADRVGVGLNDPSVTFNVGHASHGIGMAYMGASALPDIAGVFTDSSSGQTGFGSLLIKARTDFAPFYGISFYTASTANTPTERMRLDAAGNLGLGVTPSAWNSTYKAIQIGNSLGLLGAGGAADLYFNAFFDSGSAFKYLANAAASAYSLASGQHRWYTAASGTAGDPITFSQAMTLDASGICWLGRLTETLQTASVLRSPTQLLQD